MSKKSLAVGTGAMAFKPLVDIAAILVSMRVFNTM